MALPRRMFIVLACLALGPFADPAGALWPTIHGRILKRKTLTGAVPISRSLNRKTLTAVSNDAVYGDVQSVTLDKMIDLLLSFIRRDDALQDLYGTITIPGEFGQDDVTLSDLEVSNVLNVYRDGPATLKADDDSLTVSLSVQLLDLYLDGNWFDEGTIIDLDGTISFRFDSIAVSAVVTLDQSNVSLTSFKVLDIGYIECTDVSGAFIFDGMVEEQAEELINSDDVKATIAQSIEKQARATFDKIFGGKTAFPTLLAGHVQNGHRCTPAAAA